jgi:hypothetical protein
MDRIILLHATEDWDDDEMHGGHNAGQSLR